MLTLTLPVTYYHLVCIERVLWFVTYYIKRLLTSDGNIPKAYGLIKIHKAGNPLRVIVSSINSPLYYLSLYLHNIIIKNISQAASYIKDSSSNRKTKWHGFQF